MDEQDDRQVITLQRPITSDSEMWKAFWEAQGQPWRTEPDIDVERQAFLTERRAIAPNIKEGIYPFKDIKLSRADVEWLLVTHENGRGPVNWNDEHQRERKGLDLRGADLREAELEHLPLAGLIGSLEWLAWMANENTQGEHIIVEACVNMEGANLFKVHLENALLSGVHLAGANFKEASLERAVFYKAHLEGADFSKVYASQVDFGFAYMEEALFRESNMEEALFSFAFLKRTDFSEAHLERANFTEALMEMANFYKAHLDGAEFSAEFKEEMTDGTHLEGASFYKAHLEGANLSNAYLGGKKVDSNDVERVRKYFMRFPEEIRPQDMRKVQPAILQQAFFDAATNLENIHLGDEAHGFAELADVRWGDVNLAVVDWKLVKVLGDEDRAMESIDLQGKKKDQATCIDEHLAAVRANRQLAVVLRNQGLNEDAARFAHHAQLVQRKVFWYEGKFLSYLFSLFLDLLAGYGFKPLRSFIAYLLIIIGFATAYYILGETIGPSLSPLGSIVFSMTSFHGRGFFPGGIKLDDPLTVLAAIEAFVGLLIEVTFIATLTQRLFGK